MADRRFEIDRESLPNLPGMMLVTVEALKSLPDYVQSSARARTQWPIGVGG